VGSQSGISLWHQGMHQSGISRPMVYRLLAKGETLDLYPTGISRPMVYRLLAKGETLDLYPNLAMFAAVGFVIGHALQPFQRAGRPYRNVYRAATCRGSRLRRRTGAPRRSEPRHPVDLHCRADRLRLT
jgi:predicted DNA-binding transcriptional regulator AlpA